MFMHNIFKIKGERVRGGRTPSTFVVVDKSEFNTHNRKSSTSYRNPRRLAEGPRARLNGSTKRLIENGHLSGLTGYLSRPRVGLPRPIPTPIQEPQDIPEPLDLLQYTSDNIANNYFQSHIEFFNRLYGRSTGKGVHLSSKLKVKSTESLRNLYSQMDKYSVKLLTEFTGGPSLRFP
jgi:hypothetical protein